MSTYDMILEKGIEKGIEKGKIEGKIEGKVETVLKAFDNGYKIDDILLFTDFTETQIIEILKTNNRI